MLERRPLKRLTRGIPVLALLSAAEVLKLATEHLGKLEPQERRRLASLVGELRHGPGALGAGDRAELARLLAKLEPRIFAGSLVRQFSPVPVPERLAYGRARRDRKTPRGGA